MEMDNKKRRNSFIGNGGQVPYADAASSTATFHDGRVGSIGRLQDFIPMRKDQLFSSIAVKDIF